MKYLVTATVEICVEADSESEALSAACSSLMFGSEIESVQCEFAEKIDDDMED